MEVMVAITDLLHIAVAARIRERRTQRPGNPHGNLETRQLT